MKKSISYTVCEYDYLPDYEETYKDVTFTVGIDLMGNMGFTIEFPTEKEMLELLNAESWEELKKYDESTYTKPIDIITDYFVPYDFDTFIDKDARGNKAVLLVRRPFLSMKPPKCQQVITPERLEQARRKYRKSFKRYSDVMPNYIKQKKWIDDNPLTPKLVGLTDDEINEFLDDFNEKVMIHQGITLHYPTIESITMLMHNFIDDYIKMKENKSDK